MQITYSNDPARGPGYGKLELSQSSLSAGSLSLNILRASDQYYLSSSGQWLPEKALFQKNATDTPDGALSIDIGPDIVNALDPQEQYRLIAEAADGKNAQGRFQVQNVIFSSAQNLENTASPKLIPEPIATVQSQTPEPEPEPKISLPEPEKLASPAPEKKNHLLRWLMVIFLALACALWFIFDQRRKDAPAPEKTTSEQAAKATEPGQAPRARTAEEEVRLFFSGKEITAKTAAELSRRLPKDSQIEQDAVYRLYYFAANQGEPSVYLDFAACLDPAKPQWGSIAKDAPQALAIYEKALGNPDDAAKARQDKDSLKSWLEKESASGNAQAKVWLGQISR